jgi:hypothetical protein
MLKFSSKGINDPDYTGYRRKSAKKEDNFYGLVIQCQERAIKNARVMKGIRRKTLSNGEINPRIRKS